MDDGWERRECYFLVGLLKIVVPSSGLLTGLPEIGVEILTVKSHST